MSLDQEPEPAGELRIEAYKWLQLAAAQVTVNQEWAAKMWRWT